MIAARTLLKMMVQTVAQRLTQKQKRAAVAVAVAVAVAAGLRVQVGGSVPQITVITAVALSSKPMMSTTLLRVGLCESSCSIAIAVTTVVAAVVVSLSGNRALCEQACERCDCERKRVCIHVVISEGNIVVQHQDSRHWRAYCYCLLLSGITAYMMHKQRSM
jgi:hypothetical protein